MSPRFVHPNLHSEFSLADGKPRVGALVRHTPGDGRS